VILLTRAALEDKEKIQEMRFFISNGVFSVVCIGNAQSKFGRFVSGLLRIALGFVSYCDAWSRVIER